MTATIDDLGTRLRRLRKARGMTLRDVRAATGVSISHVSGIERDASGVGLDRLARLAACYGVAVGALVDGPDAGPLPPLPSERWLLCPHCERRVVRIEEVPS